MNIVGYRPELRDHFERLNLLWLEEHALLEPVDLEYLRDPEGTILADGGEVFFALDDTDVVGTCAALRLSASTFELAKLAVDPTARGRGIGRSLCQAVLAYARERGAEEIILTSHTSLSTAIALYESLAFHHAPLPADLRYATANVFMRMNVAR
jgi:putative acetyltransferase